MTNKPSPGPAPLGDSKLDQITAGRHVFPVLDQECAYRPNRRSDDTPISGFNKVDGLGAELEVVDYG